MKLLRSYENKNYIWVYSEPDFSEKELKEMLRKSSVHKDEEIIIVSDNYPVKANIAIVKVHREGLKEIFYNDGKYTTSPFDMEGFIKDRNYDEYE